MRPYQIDIDASDESVGLDSQRHVPAIGGYPHDCLADLVMVFGIADVKDRRDDARSVDIVGALMDLLALGYAKLMT